MTMRGSAARRGRSAAAAVAGLGLVVAAMASHGAGAATQPRHLIYQHGRIVQEQQRPRPQHPRFGFYELEKILDAFRARGFEVTGTIRPRSASVSQSADALATQVRKLLAAGVPADRVTVVGASMGAAITLLASTRLQHEDLRFAILGACLSLSVRGLLAEEGRGPSGHLLAIREASDETTAQCPPWKDEASSTPSLHAREIVLETGQSHGFLYRPLPEWLEPVVDWANAR